MRRVTLRAAWFALLLLHGLAAAAPGQNGPGLPSVSYPGSQLFSIIATIGSGNHGHAFVHNGYLGILRTGAGLSFHDIANPYAPVALPAPPGMGLSEPHTYALTTAHGGEHLVVMRGSGLGGTGFGIYDVGTPGGVTPLLTYQLPNVPGGYASGLFWLFVQGRYVYCPVGSLGLLVVDTLAGGGPAVVASLPKSALGGFNTVLAFAVGNTLVLANSDSGAGYALLDIGDPVRPVLLYSDPNTPIPYGAQVNAGRFLVPTVSGCANCSGGNQGSFNVYDLGAASLSHVATVGLPSRGASAVVQDRFVHIAASRSYLKLDLSQPGLPVVGRLDNPYSGGDFDWVTPLGNLCAIGDDQGFGTQLVPHDSAPDTTGPAVTMVVPADQATNQPLTSRVGITLSDMVDLDSVDATTFAVRPVGGQALAGHYSVQFGVVNFSPLQPLQANTTYEVAVPAQGLRDWSGNATAAGFTSLFSTGQGIGAVQVTAQPTTPVRTGQTAAFAVANATGPGPLTYSWDFGDGSPPTPFSTSGQASHAYAAAGHYSARVTATDGNLTGTTAVLQTVHHALTPQQPTRSGTIVYAAPTDRVWCVNADNDTVTSIDVQTLRRVQEPPTGPAPRTLAVAPDGTVWVVCAGDATIRVHHGMFGLQLATIALPPGSAPYGIAMSPDGQYAYVTLRATGEVARLSPWTRTLLGTTPVGPEPKGIAVASGSERIYVSRFLSPDAAGEVYELSASAFALVRTVPLAIDPGPDTENSGRGLPNCASSLTISPDGRRLWVPSKKDNVLRGVHRDGLPLTFESTVRAICSQVDVLAAQEDLAARVDFNDRDMPFAVEFSRLGDYAFTVLQGSNAVDVRDAYTGELVAGIEATGLAPQGLVLTPDQRLLFVHNFTSRTVAVYDVAGVTASTSFAFVPQAEVATVFAERLPADVLRGKQVFYNAADPRMSEDGYLSCASCHLDGGHDGRTWDFTDRGEGLRNTTTLLGRKGMAHGRVHWTANFDEIQDFENDIRNAFGGAGFLSEAQWRAGTTSQPLGQPKAGLDPDLDALAAYVASLGAFGRSPHRDPGGGLPAAAQRGAALFAALDCASCHSGPGFTDSPSGRVHDVGTIGPGSGAASGGPLLGIDTPTLRGLWATAPYLHDGSAPTLLDVLTTRNPLDRHGATSHLTAGELQDLVAWLLSIDDDDPACLLPGTGEDVALQSAVAPAAPDGHCQFDVRGGDVVQWRVSSPGSAFAGAVAALALQVHAAGARPVPPLPGLHVDRVDALLLALPLPVGGAAFATPIPPGLADLILRAQAVVLAPGAQNGTFAASDAHDAWLR